MTPGFGWESPSYTMKRIPKTSSRAHRGRNFRFGVLGDPVPEAPPAEFQYVGTGLLDDLTTPISLELTVRTGIVNTGGAGFGSYNADTTPGLFTPTITGVVFKVDGIVVGEYDWDGISSDEIYVIGLDEIQFYVTQAANAFTLALVFTGGTFVAPTGDLPADISIAACGWTDIDVDVDMPGLYDGTLTTWVKTGDGGP